MDNGLYNEYRGAIYDMTTYRHNDISTWASLIFSDEFDASLYELRERFAAEHAVLQECEVDEL